MAVMREKWTDERLDDLNKRVDDGFLRVDGRFNRVDERFIHLERTMTQWFIALVGIQITMLIAMIAGFVAIATRI
ncbi:MAG: hypothetical protein QOE75_1473 [Solirubrobacterales bacterium]|jgi:hypothetical protein|nr:hypothetical protein [Solirubrobacterales bacterium]